MIRHGDLHHSGKTPWSEANCRRANAPLGRNRCHLLRRGGARDGYPTRPGIARHGGRVLFLPASMAIRKQARTWPGALGISLVAHPMQKRFLTLTAWTDREALNGFVAARPHRDAMKRYRPKMNHPVFVTWSMPASLLPPTWAEAKERMEHDPTGP